MMMQDTDFFSPIGEIEAEVLQMRQNYETYIGNLKASKCYEVLPQGYIVILDADNYEQLKTDDEKNYIFVKMMRKIIQGEKKIIPVCLKCNEDGKASAIINGTSHVLPDNTIMNELIKCKHEVISKVLYTSQRVIDVESISNKCTVLKNTDKTHIAASWDGQSYAIIVCKIGLQSNKGKCCSCKGTKCGHQDIWNKEMRSFVLKEDISLKATVKDSSSNSNDEDDVEEQSNEKVKILERGRLKFPPTETTQVMFRKYESEFYDNKDVFFDEISEGQKCISHGNDWSNLNPVEMGWCFSNKVKIAHTTFVRPKERKVFFRKTVDEKCPCQLLYEGEEDFILRIGGSNKVKGQNRSVSLISYGLLTDFTLDFMENGQSISGFYNAYLAKCKMKFGMKSSDMISLVSWKKAVNVFWKEVLKLDMKKSFSCENCGNLPATLVFDGIALGVQIKKVKAFQERMQFVLSRESDNELCGTKYTDRNFIKLKRNKTILNESVRMNEWPKDVTIKGNDEHSHASAPKVDAGMQKFWTMISKQDRSGPVPEGLLLLMSNLATATSTSNLFQVVQLGFVIRLYLLMRIDAHRCASMRTGCVLMRISCISR